VGGVEAGVMKNDGDFCPSIGGVAPNSKLTDENVSLLGRHGRMV
jgi:hypothetical protein